MKEAVSQEERSASDGRGWSLSAWCVLAAFGTYFCMYAFRKPFTAAGYQDVVLWGVGYKTVLVTAQVLGYTLSKFLGIKVVAEVRPHRRAALLLGLIAAAEGALLLFGLTPPPFLMATATLRLPLPSPPAGVVRDVGRLRHALRDAQFNPDRHGTPVSPQWTDRKRALLDLQHAAATTGLTRAERRARRPENRERSLAFRELRTDLAAMTQPVRESLGAQLQSAEQQTSARAVLASREYSASLFPEPMLLELFNRARSAV